MGTHLYSIQTVASLLSRVKYFKNDNNKNIQISLLNVNSKSRQHEELPLMQDLLHIVNFTHDDNINWNSFFDYPKLKEMYDYARIMAYYHSNRTMCDNILLIEDDAIASHDWYEKIVKALDEIQSKTNKRWLCLKLFTSFRFYDFFIHFQTLFQMIFYVLFLTLIQVILFVKFSSRFIKSHFFILFVNTFLIQVWLKSTHVSPLDYGLHEYSLGFNAVANVYPREILQDLATFLGDYFKYVCDNFKKNNIIEMMPKDEYLNEFKKRFNLKEFILEPSVFQHVGLQSSKSYEVFTEDRANYKTIYKRQFKPFQSYSFLREYAAEIRFNSNEWSLT